MGPAPMHDAARRSWPDYQAVWRWHFYAGLFCLPFFCMLALTGSVYLFRPGVEAWLDRPYEGLSLDGPRAPPSQAAEAAVRAVPGSVFSHYEPPATPTGAAQVVVSKAGRLLRVYVHPVTLKAMKVEEEDLRPMNLLAHLHGHLLLGNPGSMLVELAGSWGVVMILTGLYLWLPRGAWRLGGLVYPRLGRQGRLFWRDLHAVAGLWISLVTLFLLLSGLPWSAFWGGYFSWARNLSPATAGPPDWPIGTRPAPAPHVTVAPGRPAGRLMPGMTDAEMAQMSPGAVPLRPAARGGPDLAALDRLAPLAARLDPPRPVWISPPAAGATDWTIASEAQDRPLRVTYAVDPATGAITGRSGFAEENAVDRVVNLAVAAHEGQLFGPLNQALLLANAAGVLLVSVSAALMWWRRRPAQTLGAPAPAARPRGCALLLAAIGVLAVLIPLFALSLALVLLVERTLLRRLPGPRRWLGLRPAAPA